MSYKKPLKEWQNDYENDSSIISELIRNLSFAGIGLIWIFKNSEPSGKLLPQALVCPILLIVVALSFDLLQYIWRIGVNYFTYRKYEKLLNEGKIDEKHIDDIQINPLFMIVTWALFVFKIALVLSAYLLISKFLITKI